MQHRRILTTADLAARTRTAVDAAARVAERHGCPPTVSEVLHDQLPVLVALEPEPVVVRMPTVLPPGDAPEPGRIRQRREVAAFRPARRHPTRWRGRRFPAGR